MRAEDFLNGASSKAPMSAEDFLGPSEEQNATPKATDYLKGIASGVGGLASGVGYLAEAAGADKVGAAIRGVGDTTQQYWKDAMTPAGKRAAESQVFEDDPGSTLPKLGDRWGQALGMGVAQSAPSMLAAAIPGGIAAAGLRGIAGLAASRGIGGALAPLAAGTAAPIGGWGANLAGQVAARVPTALGFGAAEGATAGAMNAAQWKSDIEQRPEESLAALPGYASLAAQIGPEAARRQIAEQGAADIMRNTTLSTGAIGALTGGGALGSAFQRATTGAKGGLIGAIGRDAAKEAFQEAPQSAGERLIQNVATRDYIDPNQTISQGVLSDALSGAAIGGVMGGVTGGGSYAISGPLSKAVAASPGAAVQPSVPVPDAGIGAGSGGISPQVPVSSSGIDQQTPVSTAGIASAAQPQQAPTVMPVPQATQNAPAAPGSPSPVSAADTPLPAKQAEAAGAPIQPPQGPLPSANQTEVAIPPAQGPEAAALPVAAKPANGIAAASIPSLYEILDDQSVGESGSVLHSLTSSDIGRRVARTVKAGDPNGDEKLTLLSIAEINRRLKTDSDVDHMRSDALAKTGWSAHRAMSGAELPNNSPGLQYPQQVTEGGGPLAQQAADMPLGRFGNSPRKADISPDISPDMPAKKATRIASSSGIAGALVTPQQPTFGGAPLEQKPAAMPIGEYGKVKAAEPAAPQQPTSVGNAESFYMSPIVKEMVGAASDSAKELRDKISGVKFGPIVDGVETIKFALDGKNYVAKMVGRNRDFVLSGKDSESDRGYALRALVDGHATPESGEPQTPKKDDKENRKARLEAALAKRKAARLAEKTKQRPKPTDDNAKTFEEQVIEALRRGGKEPPIAPGKMRLYRAEPSQESDRAITDSMTGKFWTTDRSVTIAYGDRLYYVDVPSESVEGVGSADVLAAKDLPEGVGAKLLEPGYSDISYDVFAAIEDGDYKKAEELYAKSVASRQTPPDAPQQQTASAFDSDSFDKKRNEAIKASRAAGNVHLDKLDASVEGMRGKTIFYVHNPQQRGVIRTVDNSGLVYVYWADQYSADRESASKVEEPNKSWLKLNLPYWKSVENKKTFVYQSFLNSGDLKDYVVEKPQQEKQRADPQQPLSGAGAPQARRQPQPAPIMRRDDLVGAIMRVTGGDGIASNMALTIAGDTAGRGLSKLRGLFTNRGTIDLGEVATRLREDEGFDVRDGEHLSELIRAASFGDTAVSMERASRDQDTAEEKRHRDYIRQNAKKLKIKSVAVKFTDLEQRVIAALTRRHERAIELLEERAKKRFDAALEESYALLPEDVVDAVLVDVNGRGLKTLEFLRQATTTLRYMVADAKAQKEQEALNAIEGAEPDWLKDDDGRGNQPAGGGEEANRVVEEAGGEAGFNLAAQTPEEIAPIAQEQSEEDRRLAAIRQMSRTYWHDVARPRMIEYLNAYDAFGKERLERNRVKPEGLDALGWLKKVASQEPTWDRGRKIGLTGIQMLSQKDLWPTGDSKGERLRKSMLAAVRAYKNSPSWTGNMEQEVFGVPQDDKENSPSIDLVGQTPEEIAAAEAAAKEAKQAEAAAAAAEARKEKAAQDKAEKDRRAAEVLKEREAAKKAEVDKAAEEFALGQAAPEPVVKKVTTEEAKGQKDIFAAPAPVEPRPAAKEAIGDFGEKLEGARKDYAAQMKDAMNVDVAAEPLSKSWPEPDYQKLLDGGADPKTVAIVRAARDQVATKPLKAWKIKGWAPDAITLRSTANKLLNGEISRPQAEASFNVDGFNETARSIIGRAELYELVGHKMSLKGVSFAQHFYSLYKGQENVRKWVVEQKAKATVFSNWPRELAVGDTKEEALDAFKDKIASLDLGAGAKRQPQFVIYRKRGEPGAWVGKKIGREYIDLHKAADVVEARKYMAESLPALEAKLAKYKETPLERKADNQPRVGDDHRNGAPVTPEVFADTFGFRGVQFGNYVEQNRRQSDLNEAFDGLMDLAAVLGITPRALSLNGQLGLAFGARGRGGKNAPAAHFETGRVVINLTKGGGPGSLAHEWWHSLDNYFAKQANKNSTEFVTAGARTDGVREAMRVAFNAVNLATSTKAYQARSAELDKRRSKPYWNTSEERSARAFEGYVIAKLFDQGAANDYLANVVSNEVWDITEDARAELFGEGKTPKTYPYPTVDEMPAVRAAFDEFFKAVETKEGEDGNVALFSFAGQQSATADQFQLDRAKQLLADGANANAVRQQTGWFKNPSDGKWRYEIDDSGASLQNMRMEDGLAMRATSLETVLDHPALFAAYPALRDMDVQITIDPDGQEGGSFERGSSGDSKTFGRKHEIKVNARTEEKALSTLLHEIQHGIQNVEGFASGGNPRIISAEIDDLVERKMRLSDYAGMGNESAAQELKKVEKELQSYGYDAYAAYRKLAGEVESRNVQQRQNFPADKRRYSDPLGTQDVAPEDVIVMFNGKDAKDAPPPFNTTRASAMAAVGASPADAAVFDMASEGRSAQEILAFLSKASRRPFNRVLAAALSRIGVASTVSIDPAAGWRNNQGRNGAKFAASYSPKTDTVSLYTPREAERHALHEFVHSATLKAIARGGPAARQMQSIFDYVQKTGAMSDQYGMGNFSRFPNETDAQFKKRALDEFTAELFTNPQFQVRLKQLPAPSGSKLKSAWDWIVRVIANLLGLKTKAQETALDRALSVGAALLQENAALTMPPVAGTRYHTTWHGSPHKFYTFDLSKIGTGEGAQAYGHGLYVAEAPEVAKDYQKNLSQFSRIYGRPIVGNKNISSGARAYLLAENADLQKAIQNARDAIVRRPDNELLPPILKELESLNPEAISKSSAGNFYKVDLPAEAVARMLDWDAGLHDNPRAVKIALEKDNWDTSTPDFDMDIDVMTGEDVIRELFDQLGSKQAVSDRLLSMGIVGTRYLDKDSRDKGKGTSNFVLFDDKLARIIEVNGVETGVQPWQPGEWEATQGNERFSQEQPFSGREVAATPLKPGTTTLMVDGVERPALNSNGKPIHWSEEGVRNFWRWFQNSAVTDDNGRPLVLFHGATADFGENDAPVAFDFSRTADEDLSSGKGAYLTTSAEAASKYSAGISWGNAGQASAPNVMPVYARIEAPFSKTATYRIEDFESVLPEGVVESAKEIARPGEEFIEETMQAIDDLNSKLAELESGFMDDETLQEYRIDENDYENDDDYQAAVEEAIEDEVKYVTRKIERYEGEIERAWSDAKKEYANARMTGAEIWDAIKKDLPEYTDWKNERQLIGGDTASIEMDTEVARILFDAFGFDGVKRTDTFPIQANHTVYIANNAPEQVKSATANTGAFSEDTDIRYSLATNWQQSPVAQQVSKAFDLASRSDKKLSWLNPVQTQYHKAERLAVDGRPLFKRVFDLGQKFLNDISRFAVMAENAAPTLFHQIKSIADVRQAAGEAIRGDFGKQRNADIRAIAAPLYEGTLYGGGNPMSGIVWTESQLRQKFGLTDRQITIYQEAREAVKVSMDEMAKSLIARHAKREKVMVDSSLSLSDVADEVSNALNLRAAVFKDDAEAAHDEAMQQVKDLRDAGQDKRADADEKIADAKLESAMKEVERIGETIKDIKAVADKANKLQEAGYFPLMRFGKHTVTAKDADGKVQHFSMHDGIPLVHRSGQIEANKLADALREENPDWTVTTGLMNPEKYKLYQGMNVDALQLFADHLDEDTKQTYQEIIRLATNERSALKRMIKREGTPGFDKDVRRTLASFIMSNARYTSSSYHLSDMTKAAESAEKDGGDIGAEAVKLVDYITKPQEEAAKIRGFLFFNFLGGSLAAAMVNATQIPMMTFPRLSQYEPAAKLAARLARVAKMAMLDPAKVPGDIGYALRRAEEDGITAPHQIYELTGTASNNIFAGSRGANAIMRAWSAPFALAESFNRRATFLASYEIAKAMTPAQLQAAGVTDAYEFAAKMIAETQGIYNRGNRVNVGRGALGATVMTFKQFSIMYMEMLSRMPPKQQAIMVGMLLLAAGAGGLPFAEDAEDIIDTIGQWMGYRTNTKRTIRNALGDAIGQTAADVTMNGLLSRIGVDLHSRLGLHNILPGSALLKPSTTDKSREFQDLLGPAASVVASLGQAMQNIAEGKPGRAAMALAPVAIQNAVKGGRMAATGRAEDMTGKPTIQVNASEAVAKGIGFNPKAVADYGTAKRDILQDERLLDVWRERFTADIVQAVVAQDAEALQEARQALADWNARHPNGKIAINPAAIRRRVAEMRTEGPQRVLKSLTPALRQQARQELYGAQ